MDKYYLWFNGVFFLLSLFAIRNIRLAMMFTIVIGIPLSYSLRPLILGRKKKSEEEIIIESAEKADFDFVNDKKEKSKDQKTVNLTINLNVDKDNSENVKKVINEVIDGVTEGKDNK